MEFMWVEKYFLKRKRASDVIVRVLCKTIQCQKVDHFESIWVAWVVNHKLYAVEAGKP